MGAEAAERRRGRLLTRLRSDRTLARVFANSAWLVGASGAGALLNGLQGIVVARALGVAGFGTLGLIVTFVTVCGRFTSFRMNEFVIQYHSRTDKVSPDDASATVKLSLIVESSAAGVAFGVLWLSAPLAAAWLVHQPETTPLIRLYSATLLGGLVNETSIGILQLYGRFRTCSVASTAGAALSVVGVLVAVVLGWGIAGIVWALVAGAVVTGVVLTSAALSEVRRRLGREWWRARLRVLHDRRRAIVGFVLSTNATATLSLVARDADLLWIGLFRNPLEAGYYRLAYTVANVAWLPIGALTQSIFPEIARKVAEAEWSDLYRLLRRGTLLVTAYVLPVIGVFGLLGAPLVALLYGKSYTPAVPALLILLVGNGLAHLAFWGRPTLVALHRPAFPMKVALVFLSLKMAGVFLLVPHLGFLACAVLAAMPFLPGALLCVWKVKQLLSRTPVTHSVTV
jgi:O-antigen/teichoic acid export membrane protein